MSELTYLEIALERLLSIRPAVDAALAEAGLDPLTAFAQGAPDQIRETGTPYAWLEWEGSGDEPAEGAGGGVVPFTMTASVVVVLGAPQREALERACTRYGPRIAAVIEREASGPYRILTGTPDLISKVGRGNRHLGAIAIPVVVTGWRTRTESS